MKELKYISFEDYMNLPREFWESRGLLPPEERDPNKCTVDGRPLDWGLLKMERRKRR